MTSAVIVNVTYKMSERLEFELEEEKNMTGLIHYNVLRKGLCVGILVLVEPYERKEAKRKLMSMHNQLINE